MASRMHEQFDFVCKVTAVKPNYFMEEISHNRCKPNSHSLSNLLSIGISHLIHTWDTNSSWKFWITEFSIISDPLENI